MLWLLALTAASANDVHFELTTDDGVSESWTKPAAETWADQFGPVQVDKKMVAKYLVNAPPGPYASTEGGYRVEVSICREWVKGKNTDRDCSTETFIAPPEASGPATETTKVKGTDTWQYTLKVWFTGEPPAPVTVEPEPMPEVEPEPAGTVEIGE
jgi:hypothetical protein